MSNLKSQNGKFIELGELLPQKIHDVIVKHNLDITVKNETAAENLFAEI